MNRTITIRGTGSISVKPDLTTVAMSLKACDKNYDKAMSTAADKLEKLRGALKTIGFDKEELKTASFNVNAEYESVRDAGGNYTRVFKGYCCVHRMKLEFGFDTSLLGSVLRAVAESVAEPEINISFTVKDKESVSGKLLESAVENAKSKAGILTKASGVSLGELVSVSYNFENMNLISPTSYAMEDRCMKLASVGNSINITPEDIELTDSAVFVWEII